MGKLKSQQTDGEAGGTAAGPRSVFYVVNRPYSAGEAPDIVPARVRREHEGDPDVLDLYIRAKDNGGEPLDVYGVRRSERQEPGTWYAAEEVKS